MKKIEAIIRHFKLEDVKNALTEQGIAGHDGHRGPRLRPAEGPHRDVPRHGVRGGLRAQDQGRGGRARRQGARVLDTIIARPRPARSATARCSSAICRDVVRIRTGESGEAAI